MKLVQSALCVANTDNRRRSRLIIPPVVHPVKELVWNNGAAAEMEQPQYDDGASGHVLRTH